MLAFLKALVLLPVAFLAILLAIANRAPVTLSFDPFAKGPPELALTVPLYGLLFATLALGLVIGGVAAWLSGGRARRSGRASRREAKSLKQEADRLRATTAAPGRETLPVPYRAA